MLIPLRLTIPTMVPASDGSSLLIPSLLRVMPNLLRVMPNLLR
jgi:hypothetical protein